MITADTTDPGQNDRKAVARAVQILESACEAHLEHEQPCHLVIILDTPAGTVAAGSAPDRELPGLARVLANQIGADFPNEDDNEERHDLEMELVDLRAKLAQLRTEHANLVAQLEQSAARSDDTDEAVQAHLSRS